MGGRVLWAVAYGFCSVGGREGWMSCGRKESMSVNG